MLLRPRRRGTFRVEQFRNTRVTGTVGTQVKDPADDRRFRLVDLPLDMGASAIRSHDLDVVVAKHAPTRDVACSRLTDHGVVRALPSLLAFELVCDAVSESMI